MPELPEVETIARGLKSLVVDKSISDIRIYYPGIIQGDAALFRDSVAGRTIVRVWRRAKLLLMDMEDSSHLVFHLKMTGKVWVPEPGAEIDKHTHIVFEMDNGISLFFQDQRKFGYCSWFSSRGLKNWRFFASLGPEPLDISLKAFAEIIRARKSRIKALLLDQKVIAGIGNIYADESLFMSGIHPEARGCCLSDEDIERLYDSLQTVLVKAIEAGGSSFRNYRNALGYSGMFQENFLVYGKKGSCCPRCGSVISTCKVAGRTSSICTSCQVF